VVSESYPVGGADLRNRPLAAYLLDGLHPFVPELVFVLGKVLVYEELGLSLAVVKERLQGEERR
jgi:hypothetical protein